ncbi:hypothetical protein MBLNU457_2158t1 [Dothideomycetes sp. NU457]
MASFIPSYIQKRLLRYALLRTGLLEADALELESFDITLGKQNRIELRDVGLHVQKLTSLLQLPDELKLLTARILVLRIVAPADLYNGSIEIDVDGVEGKLALSEAAGRDTEQESRSRTSSTKTPQHRKSNRRLRSPVAFRHGRQHQYEDNGHVPNTEDLAMSFLQEEPQKEKQELEQIYSRHQKSVSESVSSDASDNDVTGTGTDLGLPGFLATFLQRITDKIKIKANNIILNVEIPLSSQKIRAPTSESVHDVALRMKIARIEVGPSGVDQKERSVEDTEHKAASTNERSIIISDVCFSIMTPWTEHLQSNPAPTPQKPGSAGSSPLLSSAHRELAVDPDEPADASSPSSTNLHPAVALTDQSVYFQPGGESMVRSLATESGRPTRPNLHQAYEESVYEEPHVLFDIQPGEDNLSWTDRRSRTGTSEPDLWSDPSSSQNLTVSMLADERHLRSDDTGMSSSDTALRRSDHSNAHQSVDAGDHGYSTFLPRTSNDEEAPDLDTPRFEDGSVTNHSSPGEDMSQSRFFDPEEARSMYASAISHRTAQSTRLRGLPGGWDQYDEDEETPVEGHRHRRSTPGFEESPVTPRATSPAVTTPSTERRQENVICSIDEIAISLTKNLSQDSNPNTTRSETRTGNGPVKSSERHQPPGTFSLYAEQSASVRFESAQLGETVASLPARPTHSPSIPTTRISVGRIGVGLRIELLCLVAKVTHKLSQVLKADRAENYASKEPQPPASASSLILELRQTRLAFTTAAPEVHLPDQKDLVEITLSDAHLKCMPHDTFVDYGLEIGKCSCHVLGQETVHFAANSHPQVGVGTDRVPDIRIDSSTGLRSGTGMPVNQVSAQTNPLVLSLDLETFDAFLASCGGMSGLIELSGSMMSSDSSNHGSPRSTPRKGVRFEDSLHDDKNKPETKLQARIGGCSVNLRGKSCSLKLSSSSIKLVSRPNYVAVATNLIRLTTPTSSGRPSQPSFEVRVKSTRLEYLYSPSDDDLERLLLLLTPSKNKYENDDDIIIDTLLRQRRKGAVLRITPASVSVEVNEWSFTERLQSLAAEMSAFSAVAKYLPEDERPGMLTLVRAQTVQFKVPINAIFGPLDISAHDVQAAQIGLPALWAVSVGELKAGRNGGSELIHGIIPVQAAENVPMIIARMVGDEIDPSLRLKIFNFCVEYSVPVFLALTGFDADVRTEQVIDLAASTMLDLAGKPTADTLVSPTSSTSSTSRSAKKLTVDVLLRDCELGLEPTLHSSKAKVLFNDTRFTTVTPPSGVFEATLELRKASIFITDDRTMGSNTEDILRHPLSARLEALLINEGYVSVSSIMSARIAVDISESSDKSSRYVDLGVRDELFVLETCADSTQTLIQVLGALAPPSKPSQEPKFRTEALTLDDMISSFTGNAFEKPPEASIMFDTDESPQFEEDDMLAASAMSASVYGGLDALVDPEEEFGNDAGHVAESLLEEDPFEMPDTPEAAKLSDDELIRHLQSQMRTMASGPTAELRPYLISDTQLDNLPGSATVLGAAHRWNTPRVDFPRVPEPAKVRPPFRLKVRDVHVIWNLYDGYDWQSTRTAITDAVEEVEARAEERKLRRRRSQEPEDEEESIIGDCLFNSIYIGVPANKDVNELRRQINRGINDLASETESYQTSGVSRPTNLSSGQHSRPKQRPRRLKLKRSQTHKISFELKGVSADILGLEPGSDETQNSIDVRIREFEIFDNIPTSTWRKFLTSNHDKEEMREMCKPMIHIEVLNVRPIKELSATELLLRASIMPLRLHVDQDALDFITRFFEFKAEGHAADAPSDQPFIQRLEVDTVHMCLDYKPKRVDYGGLRSGRYTEFKNFFILDRANIILKHAIVYGIKGFAPLNDTLNDIWMPDIKSNQLPGVLGGLAPVSSLVSIGTGLVDTVAIPIREYRKDGRLFRSISKGATHFARNTTSELARFGAKMAIGTQTVLQGAETLLSQQSHQASIAEDDDEATTTRQVSNYADQPLTLLQGLRSAHRHLERDLLTARDAIIAVQGEVTEATSAASAAGAVARHAPTILLRPVIGASRAVGKTLLGTANMVDRGHLRGIEDKYKRR